MSSHLNIRSRHVTPRDIIILTCSTQKLNKFYYLVGWQLAHRISVSHGGDGDGDGDGDAGGQLFLQVQCLSKFVLRPKQLGEAGMESL